ncbi:MAG: Mov34/MPN/PAD-1 family protein [Acidobacteria bacterium]|nr:Mov34/MPN/PAD-1 family protein [Acidobacteriota bacterium]
MLDLPADRSCSIAAPVMTAIDAVIAPARRQRVEGIVYLLGRTNGPQACVLSCVAVAASANYGSFFVPSREMVRVVNIANDCALQVVGQLHTHPFEAFHSRGDDAGAQIRFDGFVSIVVPDYGNYLPTLRGAAVYAYDAALEEFVPLRPDRVFLVGARL